MNDLKKKGFQRGEGWLVVVVRKQRALRAHIRAMREKTEGSISRSTATDLGPRVNPLEGPAFPNSTLS